MGGGGGRGVHTMKDNYITMHITTNYQKIKLQQNMKQSRMLTVNNVTETFQKANQITKMQPKDSKLFPLR